MVASGAVCGDAFPGNGFPVRGLRFFNSGVGGLSIDFMPTATVTDRLPRHSIRISSNRGLYCILLYRFRCAFPARLHRLNQIQQG